MISTPADVIYQVHRAHFLDELVKLVPDTVAQFGKRLESLSKKGEKMVLKFQDGTEAEADAVIGCDGIKSKTRLILLGDDHDKGQAVFSGRYAYRGLIPMEKAVEAVGEELARNSQMYMGHHGHVLTFPIEKGKTMNVVAFRTKADGKWNDEKWVLPMKQEDMFEDFRGWGDSVKHILSVGHHSPHSEDSSLLTHDFSSWRNLTYGHCLTIHHAQHIIEAGSAYSVTLRMHQLLTKEQGLVRP